MGWCMVEIVSRDSISSGYPDPFAYERDYHDDQNTLCSPTIWLFIINMAPAAENLFSSNTHTTSPKLLARSRSGLRNPLSMTLRNSSLPLNSLR